MKKRMHFRVSHRDKAERAIIRAGRSVGATVRQLNGKDLPDLCVGYKGVTYLPEVKSRILSEEKGRAPRMRTTRVSEGQKMFAEEWRGGPTGIVYEPADLLRMIGAQQHVCAGKYHWLAENGAFLCEQCWLPENGLHAKDCPTRKALKVPAKVKSAYRAAKEAREVLPKKTHQDRLNEAGAVDLRDNMRLKHLPGGYVRAEPIDPMKRHGAVEVLTKKTSGSGLYPRCEMGPCEREKMGHSPFCDIHSNPIILAEALSTPRPSRGVEGELQPIKGPLCEKRGCEEKVRGPGAKYCKAH